MKVPRKKVLYVVLDRSVLKGLGVGEAARQAAVGGADLIQYRDKISPDPAFLQAVREIQEAVSGSGVPLIVNDRIEIALESGAEGLHLGADDLPVAEARERGGESLIIGASGRTLERAREAETAGADYLGVGAFFPTVTKDDAVPIDHGLFSEIVGAVNIPVFAIGGIGGKNLKEAFAAGASGVAVASSLFDYPTIEESVGVLRKTIDSLPSAPFQSTNYTN